ncbi:RagB/SusD family nutrient uptake outer membrane protein [Marinifilum flexuosum]|uniref:RagB/SusD family nutrient uptake outer membrane protein n=1 Tax=Marinifilum flexuosum TaxID=1117708 RepID=UPI002494B0FE|nr:RagB/SusD family nutrient uptake outer membrane protein [Marinifilum flexuosum]
MKNINKLVIGLIMLMGVSSCSDYLDDPKPTDVLTAVDVYNSPEGVRAYFTGVYRMFRAQYTRTDAGGVYSFYYARSMKGNDLMQRSWYKWDYQHENREDNYTRTGFAWQFPYDVINHANTMIKEIAASTALSDADKTLFTAEAKALRAYFYFQLYLEFYGEGLGLQTPPIYTEPVTEGGAMSDPAAFRQLIIDDINAAVAGLTDDRLDKSYINVAVAQGLKARILMAFNQDWDQVEAAALAACGGDAAASLNASIYDTGFDDITNSEVIWGMYQTADQTNYYYSAPHVFSDFHNGPYKGMFVNANLVNSFSSTDVRYEFENYYGVGPGHWAEYVTNKFQFSFEADMYLMRTAEMLLIAAEAKYRNSDASGAHDLLYALQLNRDPNAVKSANTGADLLEEILYERRKELYSEIGVEWFDAKRLGRGIDRDSHHLVEVDLEPNDKRFVLKVPEDEYNANENIDESVNDNR